MLIKKTLFAQYEHLDYNTILPKNTVNNNSELSHTQKSFESSSSLGTRVSNLSETNLSDEGDKPHAQIRSGFPLAFLVINTGQTTKGDRHVRRKACGA